MHRDPHYFHYQVSFCLVGHPSNKEQKTRQTHGQTPKTYNRKTEFFLSRHCQYCIILAFVHGVRTQGNLLVFLSCSLFISKLIQLILVFICAFTVYDITINAEFQSPQLKIGNKNIYSISTLKVCYYVNHQSESSKQGLAFN